MIHTKQRLEFQWESKESVIIFVLGGDNDIFIIRKSCFHCVLVTLYRTFVYLSCAQDPLIRYGRTRDVNHSLGSIKCSNWIFVTFRRV
jgi:hypothetical protein